MWTDDARVAGVRVPVSMTSSAHVFVVGESTLLDGLQLPRDQWRARERPARAGRRAPARHLAPHNRRTRSMLTAIVSAYNEERLLPAALHSLLAQTRVPDEIIVVNNASTDGTREAALGVPGVRVVDESRKGLLWARAAGRRAAHGDILFYMDADCRAPLRLLERIRGALRASAFHRCRHGAVSVSTTGTGSASPARACTTTRLRRLPMCSPIACSASAPSSTGATSPSAPRRSTRSADSTRRSNFTARTRTSVGGSRRSALSSSCRPAPSRPQPAATRRWDAPTCSACMSGTSGRRRFTIGRKTSRTKTCGCSAGPRVHCSPRPDGIPRSGIWRLDPRRFDRVHRRFRHRQPADAAHRAALRHARRGGGRLHSARCGDGVALLGAAAAPRPARVRAVRDCERRRRPRRRPAAESRVLELMARPSFSPGLLVLARAFGAGPGWRAGSAQAQAPSGSAGRLSGPLRRTRRQPGRHPIGGAPGLRHRRRRRWVATATAVALLVDLARMPVYVVSNAGALRDAAALIIVMTAGAMLGTLAGGRVLRRIPEAAFRRIVAVLLLVLAAWLLSRA